MTTIQEFYGNNKPILCGAEYLTWEEILNKDDEWFNGCHNFVQFLYPLNKPSEYNPNAPILVKEDIPFVKPYLLTNTIRFLAFLNTQNMRVFNHNHLRITRMLECYSLVYDNNYSIAGLLKIGYQYLNDDKDGNFDRNTLKYWLDATLYGWPI